VECAELRIILCLEFDAHAKPREVSALKAALIDSPNTVHSVECTGAFDFLMEIAAPDMASFNSWLKGLAEPLASLVNRSETSFICRRFIRRPKDERAIWIQYGNGHKRIDSARVDKIVAEGDYARVHSGADSWLVHATMHALLERLSSKQFIQLHRSIIVRRDFIERLVHEGRHWIARLRDGTSERVAKSHAVETLEMTHWPTKEPASSKLAQPAEGPESR
jgi:DNA-binding LytR/AlgR family response regulator